MVIIVFFLRITGQLVILSITIVVEYYYFNPYIGDTMTTTTKTAMTAINLRWQAWKDVLDTTDAAARTAATFRLGVGYDTLKRLEARNDYWSARADPRSVVPERWGVSPGGRHFGWLNGTYYYCRSSDAMEPADWRVIVYPYSGLAIRWAMKSKWNHRVVGLTAVLVRR